jgi:hypothetical protein
MRAQNLSPTADEKTKRIVGHVLQALGIESVDPEALYVAHRRVFDELRKPNPNS